MRVLWNPVVATAGLLLSAGLVGGCGGDAAPAAAPARPVVTMALESLAPNPPLELTGVAEPYREAEVSFEVSGRITRILDVGRTVEVTTQVADGKEGATKGELIAEIDDTTYRQRKAAAELKLKTAQEGLVAQELDLRQVAPKTVARARAQRDAAEAEIASARASVQSAESSRNTTSNDLDRNRKLLRDRQISKAEFDQYQNAFDTAVANLQKAQAGLAASQQQLAAYDATLAEAEAMLRFKAASVQQTNAQIAELEIAVEQAKTDLARCKLHAPFGGRITGIYASQGDYVAAGKPVLRLALIDPIKVSVTVSADRERQIQPGSHAYVRPRKAAKSAADFPELHGTVFEKGAVADPATRTFRIDVMVRNARPLPKAESGAMRISFREILPAVERNHGEGGPLYVCSACCQEEDGEHVLYRIKGGKFAQPRPPQLFEGRLELERVVVKPMAEGPADFMKILNWSFQRVEAAEGHTLDNGDLLINFEREDLTYKTIQNGVVFERFEWAIRPGDLVRVTFDGAASPAKGLWVPDDTIRAQNETRSVFAVENGRAREIPVTVHEAVGRLRRIEGSGLAPGLKLVVVGAHYIFDGADVVVSREADLKTYLGQGR